MQNAIAFCILQQASLPIVNKPVTPYFDKSSNSYEIKKKQQNINRGTISAFYNAEA
jgi:hypothetical protein